MPVVENTSTSQTRVNSNLQNSSVPLSESMKSVPYPGRVRISNKVEKDYGKFLDILKEIKITVPVLEAITSMPVFSKFLKDLLNKKWPIDFDKPEVMSKQCNSIYTSFTMLDKKQDPGSIIVPCDLGSGVVVKALCDTGSGINLMPL